MSRSPDLWFDRNPPEHGPGDWVWVRDNLAAALSTLKSVDFISLAYDTGLSATGLDIINVIAENPAHPQKGIMIHELDPALNVAMIAALERVTYIPRYTSSNGGKAYVEVIERVPGPIEWPPISASPPDRGPHRRWPLIECAYPDGGWHCTQPVWERDSDGNLVPGSVRNVDLGKCPFKQGDIVAQQSCSLSKPDPSWPQHSWTPFDMVKKG